MQSVRPAGLDLTLSRLGFGCAPLMASLDRERSLALLAAASEAGITHFDVARSYGYGEAEGVLGEFLSGRRHAFTITTKFGIAPPDRRIAGGLVKQVARTAARALPFLRPLLRRGAARLVRGGAFDVPSARASLETSLRQLRTDYVDILLMHECSPADATNEDLLAFLDECVRSGKIRHSGIATDRTTTQSLIADPKPPAVVQFPDGVTSSEDLLEACSGPAAVFTHSSIASSLGSIRAFLADDPVQVKVWSRALDASIDNDETLGAFLVAAALERNAGGCVLVASRNMHRIAANTRILNEPLWTEGQIAAFRRLVADNLGVQPDLARRGRAQRSD